MAQRHLVFLLALIPLLVAAETTEPTPAPQAESKDAEVAKQVLELEVREAALRALEEDLNRKIEELKQLQQLAVNLIEPSETAREEQLQTLISFYQAMKPKNAARLLEKLPIQLAGDVLSAMNSRGAGKILNVMNADRAVRISRLMAGQK